VGLVIVSVPLWNAFYITNRIKDWGQYWAESQGGHNVVRHCSLMFSFLLSLSLSIGYSLLNDDSITLRETFVIDE
jgi:hypothetical protein